MRLLHAKQKALSPCTSADVHDIHGITKMQSSMQACTEDATTAVSRDDGGKEKRGTSLAGKFHLFGKAFYEKPVTHSILFVEVPVPTPALLCFYQPQGAIR